jgi:L-alanine-DL-glutamate epimerase-like enolase superfamily enzyme
MTLSLVAVITDVIRDGKPVVGYGFNSNGRYGQGKLMRERFIPRILEADPASLLNDDGTNLDPHKIWDCMFTNEKPGGHGERSVAIGTIDMAVWDAVAKIEGKPLFQLLADRYGNGTAGPQDVRLRGRRLLLSGPGPRCAEGRDAQLHRPRLHGGQEEDRRRLAR